MRRAFIVLAALLPLLACKPQDNTPAGPTESSKSAFRAICKDDIAKFCSGEKKVRRCLRQNSDKLSDACKTAVAKKKNREGKKNKDQEGGEE